MFDEDRNNVSFGSLAVPQHPSLYTAATPTNKPVSGIGSDRRWKGGVERSGNQ